MTNKHTYQSFEVSYLLSLYCLPSIYFKKKSIHLDFVSFIMKFAHLGLLCIVGGWATDLKKYSSKWESATNWGKKQKKNCKKLGFLYTPRTPNDPCFEWKGPSFRGFKTQK